MGGFSSSCWCLKLRRERKKRAEANANEEDEEEEEDGSSDFFYKYRTLEVATSCFSEWSQLGRGGFGPVYKGLLPSGGEVAVKKLSINSRQGMKEFTNEVKCLQKIQHKNLVILLGCCIEGPEKMLVYEYLPNKSLDNFLFDKDKSASLDWSKRFNIIIGVARGLLYLHEEAPERIIHRDIKVSNILLDQHMKPKISDFGLSRLFPGDDTHLDTFRIAGTYGYMAPEYVMHGLLSVKTDVYSFGILVLEIVSGRKHHDGRLDNEKADLLNYTWNLSQEGKILELIDPTLEKFNKDEVAMCIQIGLLCCQASTAERPNMNSVHLMLLSDSFNLPKPGKPGLQGSFNLHKPGKPGLQVRAGTTSTAPSNSVSTSKTTAPTRTSVSSSLDYSQNSISVSLVDEGR